MIGFILRWFINVISLLVVVNTLKGVEVSSFETLIVAALILGIINAVLRPIIILITLPINMLTLGIFTFFITGFMFYLVSKIIKGFTIESFWSAFWGAFIFSLISFLLSLLIHREGKLGVRFYEYKSGTKNNPTKLDVIDIEPENKDKDQ